MPSLPLRSLVVTPCVMALLAQGVWAQQDAPRRLNSVVTELAHVTFDAPFEGDHTQTPLREIAFTREHHGWLHIALEGELDKGARAWLTLNGDTQAAPILVGPGETMRLVDAGEHRLALWTDGAPDIRRLTVRAVPEIMMYMFEDLERPRPTFWFAHSWDFLEESVLPHSNLVVSHMREGYEAYAQRWQERGRRWVGNQGMWQLRNEDVDAAEYWAGLLSNPAYDAVIHDELLLQDTPHLERYIESLARLDEHPEAGGKPVYFYSPVGLFTDAALMDNFELDRQAAAHGENSILALPAHRVVTMRQLGLRLEPGRQYTLSAHFRTEGLARGTYTGVFVIDEGWHTTHGSILQPPEGDSDWQRVSRTFTPRPSSNELYQLIISVPTEGRMWVDAIQLEEGDTATEYTADGARNLILNSSFEDDWSGWMDAPRAYGEFARALVGTNHFLAPEFYMNEAPTEQRAQEAIAGRLVGTVADWRERFPGIGRHLLITLSAGNCCLRYSNDRHPDVSYKVLLDMQFHAIANEAAFEDLWGVGFWSAHYIDEELMRWYGALFRHYLLEGNRARFTDDPYMLDHLVNPGFEEGTEGWTLQVAAGGSIEVVQRRDMPGGGPKGRYAPVPHGERVLRTTRPGDAPNVISQTIRNLTPGRLYSARVYTTDPDYSADELPTQVTLEGVEELPERGRNRVWTVRAGDADTHWNCHYRVFRALGEEARLTLSDGAPGEVYWDFVQVEPYFEG